MALANQVKKNLKSRLSTGSGDEMVGSAHRWGPGNVVHWVIVLA